MDLVGTVWNSWDSSQYLYLGQFGVLKYFHDVLRDARSARSCFWIQNLRIVKVLELLAFPIEVKRGALRACIVHCKISIVLIFHITRMNLLTNKPRIFGIFAVRLQIVQYFVDVYHAS